MASSFLLLQSLLIGTLLLHPTSSYKCSNRYEFKEEIKTALPHLQSCDNIRRLYPICNRTLTVYYTQHPPYVDKKATASEPHGLLPDMLKMAMDVCCYGCTKIEYKGPVSPQNKFVDMNRTLYMPLEGAFEADAFYKYDYVAFLKVNGVSFIAQDLTDRAAEYASHLMESVFSTWPLFITAILMAFTAGCAIWILDSWFNNEEFPERFPRGPLEGFWWAFVTMTTVGYGDKSPKHWIARIFSIVWILVGITVFSMYTSILTAALGAKTNSFGTTNFVHKKVGVLNFTSAGEAAAFEANAKLVRFGSIEDMSKALVKQTISAMAVDNFILKYYMKHLAETIPKLKKHHSAKSEANSYGVLSYDKDISELLRSFFKTNEDQRHALALHALHKTWPDLKLPSSESPDTSFLNPSSPIFLSTLVGLLVVSLICCLIGLSCKLLFYKKPKVKQGYIDLMKWKRKKPGANGSDLTLRNVHTADNNGDSNHGGEVCLCIQCGYKCTGVTSFQRHLALKHGVQSDVPTQPPLDNETVQELLTEIETLKSKWEKRLINTPEHSTSIQQ